MNLITDPGYEFSSESKSDEFMMLKMQNDKDKIILSEFKLQICELNAKIRELNKENLELKQLLENK
jgi:hypothetical protein